MKNVMIVILLVSGATLAGCGNHGSLFGKYKYKARFEVEGICLNNTFSVIDGVIDTSLVVTNWTNPQSGKTYKNAFAMANPCLLPKNLKQGDTFYFVIDEKPRQNDCMVCLAYYPTPPKRLHIKLVP